MKSVYSDPKIASKWEEYLLLEEDYGEKIYTIEEYFYLGLDYYDQENFHEAIRCYNVALEPNLLHLAPDLHHCKGKALFRLQKYEEAIECYNQAIELDSDNADLYLDKGGAFEHSGQKDYAIECYDQAIKLNPNFALAYYAKGYLLYYLDNKVEALIYFVEAYKISKTNSLNNKPFLSKITKAINNNLAQDLEKLLKRFVEPDQLTTEDVVNNKLLLSQHPSDFDKTKSYNSICNNDQIKIDAKSNILKTDDKDALKNPNITLAKYNTSLVDVNNKDIKFAQQMVLKIKEKVNADNNLDRKYKVIMANLINDTTENIQKLKNQQQVETITQEIFKMMIEPKITKGRLIDLQDKVDDLINETESLTINIVSSIEYDNPLLNYPTLFQAAEQFFGVNKAFDLSQSLSSGLVDEAIHNNDSELLLAGIMSLHLNNHN